LQIKSRGPLQRQLLAQQQWQQPDNLSQQFSGMACKAIMPIHPAME
jgi:hypothetical protein